MGARDHRRLIGELHDLDQGDAGALDVLGHGVGVRGGIAGSEQPRPRLAGAVTAVEMSQQWVELVAALEGARSLFLVAFGGDQRGIQIQIYPCCVRLRRCVGGVGGVSHPSGDVQPQQRLWAEPGGKGRRHRPEQGALTAQYLGRREVIAAVSQRHYHIAQQRLGPVAQLRRGAGRGLREPSVSPGRSASSWSPAAPLPLVSFTALAANRTEPPRLLRLTRTGTPCPGLCALDTSHHPTVQGVTSSEPPLSRPYPQRIRATVERPLPNHQCCEVMKGPYRY